MKNQICYHLFLNLFILYSTDAEGLFGSSPIACSKTKMVDDLKGAFE